jgi:hypothetical protein
VAYRKGAGPESAATDFEARETVGIGVAVSKASPQNPQATLVVGSPAPDTVREEAAARIQELLGVI